MDADRGRWYLGNLIKETDVGSRADTGRIRGRMSARLLS